MFSRWYNLFIGFLLVILGIAGFIAAGNIPGSNPGIVTISVIWFVTGLVGLWAGFSLRDLNAVRRVAMTIGVLYFLWGAIMMFSTPAASSVVTGTTLSVTGLLTLLLGSIGLAAGLLPATWTREMPGMAAT
jgi:purine-cytosine permease-like protein